MHSYIQLVLAGCKPALTEDGSALLARLFDASFEPRRPVAIDTPSTGQETRLTIDLDMARRLAATIKAKTLLEFEQRIRIPELLPEREWGEMSAACGELARELQRRVARMDGQFARAAVDAAENAYACAFIFTDDESEPQLIRAVNLALHQMAVLWGGILDGTTTIDEAMPPEKDLLPLTCLGGTTPQACLDAWKHSQRRQYSAEKKFARVAAELEEVLNGLQVECMQPSHVKAYAERLIAKRRNPNTVANKIGVICTLLRNVEIPAATRAELQKRRPKQGVLDVFRKKRRELTHEELGTLLSNIFNDSSLRPDDRVVVTVHALTGTRIEEVCSLDSDDLTWDGSAWTMHIRLSKAELEALAKWLPTGQTVPGVKTIESLRSIPFYVDAVPGLHERLLQLKDTRGPLFKHLWPTGAGVRSSAVSKRINRRIKSLFGADSGLVFESLRNTAAPALRRAGVAWDARRVFLGHAPVDVHDRHYDKLTIDDLRSAGRAVASMVGQALEGKQFPRLDIHYDRCRRRLKSQREVSDVHGETDAPQKPPLDVEELDAMQSGEVGLQLPARDVSASEESVPSTVNRSRPDLDGPAPREREVSPHRMVPPTRRDEWVLGLGQEVQSIAFENSSDDEFRNAADTAASALEPWRTQATRCSHGVDEAPPAGSGGGVAVGAGPSLEEVEVPGALDEVGGGALVTFADVPSLYELSNPVEPTLPAQQAGPGAVDTPEVAGGGGTALDKSSGELLVRQTREGAIGKFAVPAERSRNGPLHPQHDRIVVRAARRLGPLRERVHTQPLNERAPIVDTAGSVDRARDAGNHPNSPPRYRGKRYREPNAPHGFDQRRERHASVAAPDAPSMTRQEVVQLLRHDSPTEGLIRVPERVKDDAVVTNPTPARRPQVAAKPLGPVAAAVSQSVRQQVGEEPGVARRAPRCDIRIEAACDEFWMQRHDASRRLGLDARLHAVIFDAQQETKCRVQHDIGDAQLTKLFDARPGGKTEQGEPRGSFSTTATWSQAYAVDRRIEDGLELLRAEFGAAEGGHPPARDPEPTRDVDDQASGVDLGLQHRAHEAESFPHRRCRKSLRKQRVSEADHVSAGQHGHCPTDPLVEEVRRRLELHHGSGWTTRGEVPPISECVGKAGGGMRELGRGELSDRRKAYGLLREWGLRQRSAAVLAGSKQRKSCQPFGRESQTQRLGGAAVGRLQIDANERAVPRLQSDGDAKLKPKTVVMYREIAHRDLRQLESGLSSVRLGTGGTPICTPCPKNKPLSAAQVPLRQGLTFTARYRWWRRGGSNSRPSHCERDALPAELRPQESRIIAQAADRGRYPGSSTLRSMSWTFVRPQNAIVRSSSLRMISSALVTPASPIAPRP